MTIDMTADEIAVSRHHHEAFDLHTWSLVDDASSYFTRTSEFFPHAIILRDGPISPLVSASRPGIGGIDAATSLGILPLDEFVRHAPVDGFLVVHRGRLVYERYPRMRPFDKHLLWSVSKTFPAALVAMLEDEGRLDVGDPIEAYLPELAASAWIGTPVIDILDMASGMGGLESDDPDAYTDPDAPYYLYESSLGMLRRTPRTMDSTYDYVSSLPRLRPSGEAFEYTSVNTFVLAWLAERLFGRPFAELVSERIWRRIGAESDALVIVSGIGAAASHGGISAILRDVARWGLCFTPSWSVVAASPIISPVYLRKIQTGGNPARFARKWEIQGDAADLPRGERPRHNTYQWDFVMDDGDFFKGGFRGQGLYVSPSRDLVIVFAGTQDAGSPAYARAIARSGLFDV